MTIEQEIQAKASNAPRVTPADIEAEIDSEFYFTADEGCEGAAHLHHDGHFAAPHVIRHDDGFAVMSLRLLTLCVLVLRNGYTVVGKSACASPANFNAEIGRKIAREDAIDQVWPLLGFRLRDKLVGV